MSESNKPSFYDIIRDRSERSIFQVIDDATDTLTDGDKTEKELQKACNDLIRLVAAVPNRLDDSQMADVCSMLALRCDFALSNDELETYAKKSIAACDQVDEVDDKYRAARDIRWGMVRLLERLSGDKPVKVTEKAKEDSFELKEAEERVDNEKTDRAIRVQTYKDEEVLEYGPKDEEDNDATGYGVDEGDGLYD